MGTILEAGGSAILLAPFDIPAPLLAFGGLSHPNIAIPSEHTKRAVVMSRTDIPIVSPIDSKRLTGKRPVTLIQRPLIYALYSSEQSIDYANLYSFRMFILDTQSSREGRRRS